MNWRNHESISWGLLLKRYVWNETRDEESGRAWVKLTRGPEILHQGMRSRKRDGSTLVDSGTYIDLHLMAEERE